MKSFISRFVLLVSIWLLGLFLVYLNYNQQVNNNIAMAVESRASIIRQDVDIAVSNVDSMAEQMASPHKPHILINIGTS